MQRQLQRLRTNSESTQITGQKPLDKKVGAHKKHLHKQRHGLKLVDGLVDTAVVTSKLEAKQQIYRRHGLSEAEVAAEALSKPGHQGLPDLVLEKMVMGQPWVCELVPPSSPLICGHTSLAASGLHPMNMTTSNGTHEHMNSVRMLFPLGSVPCCSTMPFCSAPACSDTPQPSLIKTCEKRSSVENIIYMTSPYLWPAYHGWSGSYEFDVQKHWDVLTSLLRQEGRVEPFDLLLDVGANSGYMTDKWTTRHFSRSYVLVDAYVGMKKMYDGRFGNETFKKAWFTSQVPDVPGATIPTFEFLNVAVNDVSGGNLDLCANSDTKANIWAAANGGQPCPVEIVALDDVIPARLAPQTQEVFRNSQSAFLKTDVEGMDEKALRGMSRILSETRGSYDNGAAKHLVNFIQLEYSTFLMRDVKQREKVNHYSLATLVAFLESMGFESFLVGPMYLPLSHGSWSDEFQRIMEDPQYDFGGAHLPSSEIDRWPNNADLEMSATTVDLFALRASHPMAAQIKHELGACQDSHEFRLDDAQYNLLKFAP